MDADAVKITLSRLRKGKGNILRGTYTKRNLPSVLTEIPINGYTLYAEEPVENLGKTDMWGNTMYLAPTSTTALIQAKRPANIPQRRSGGYVYSIDISDRIVNGYLSDKNGNPVHVKYIAKGDLPFSGKSTQFLFAATTDADALAKYVRDGRSLS